MSTPTIQIPQASVPFLNQDGTVARAWFNFLSMLVAPNAYTPTLTKVANLDAVTAYACQYVQLGSVVVVVGKLDADPTAATATKISISIPITSTFTAATDAGGVASASGVSGQSAGIYADTANARVQMEWLAVDTTNKAMYFAFMYLVR